MRKQTSRLWTAVLIAVMLISAVSGALAYVTGDDYPSKYKTPAKDAVVDEWNFYNRECTSFAAWCLNSRNGFGFHNWYGGIQWGNANTWNDAASRLGFAVNSTPAVGAIAYWESGHGGAGSVGHVAWVKAVNGSQVTIEEYNWSVRGGFGTRTFSSSTPSGYIHIADINPTGVLDINFFVNGADTVDISGIGSFTITVGGSTYTGQTDFCQSFPWAPATQSVKSARPQATPTPV